MVEHLNVKFAKSGIFLYILFSPVPVAAQAHTSLPSRAIGMVADWMGVGVTKFNPLTACKGEMDEGDNEW